MTPSTTRVFPLADAAAPPPHQAPAPQPPGERALELGEVLRIILERWRIIVLAALLGLAGGIAATLVATPLYRASALLQYDPGANDSIEGGRLAPGKIAVANQEMVATQLGLVRSEALARRVSQELNLADDPRYGGRGGTRQQRLDRATAIVQGSTEAEAVRNSLLIRVAQVSSDPAMAQRIASALARNFIAMSIERRYDASAYARRFLSDQLVKTKQALEDSEKAVNEYTIASGLFRTPAQVVDGKSTDGASLTVTELAGLDQALNQARVRRIEAENAWRAGMGESSGENASMIGAIEQQRATLSAERAQASKLFKPDYPRMQELSAQIARLDAEVANARKSALGDRGQQLRAAYRAALQSERQLEARVAVAKSRVQDDRGRSIRYNILQREVDTNRALYDALLARYKEIGVAGGIGQSNLSLVDDAQTPRAPFRPNGYVNALIGLMFGLGAGLAAAFVLHLLFDSLISAADVRSKLHLPVLGAIPFEPKAERMLEDLGDHKSEISEAYYATLTSMKFVRPGGMPRTLFITSSRPSEGKSTSAYAIAVSSARLGRRVLLIDADLRRPTFKAEQGALGFAHLLASEDKVIDHVQPTATPNLWLLPVGAVNGSPAELLSSLRLPALVKEAGDQFDLVVLDGPPLLGLTDAPLLASAAQGTVIVIESRKTRTSQAAELARRINEAGGDLLGTILTKLVRGPVSSYYYDYRYSYGGSEGRSKAGRERFDLGSNVGAPARP
ncbi:MAG: polysaccharide biosynthesis tyrosine autokinase [Sphingomonas sp.]|nr:polysaccharide biosynthesis tyrosine autokinase [Sphingomonas sp.]